MNLHPQHERNISYVRHLEPLHQLLFNVLDDLDVSSNEKKVIHVESQDDDDAVLPVYVNTGVRLERNEPESDKFRVDGLEPVPGTLSKSVKTLVQLHDEWNSNLVHLLEARRCFHVHIFFEKSV